VYSVTKKRHWLHIVHVWSWIFDIIMTLQKLQKQTL